MNTKIPLLAVMVSALVLGPAGLGLTAEPASQPLQLAKLNNTGSVKKAPKKK